MYFVQLNLTLNKFFWTELEAMEKTLDYYRFLIRKSKKKKNKECNFLRLMHNFWSPWKIYYKSRTQVAIHKIINTNLDDIWTPPSSL